MQVVMLADVFDADRVLLERGSTQDLPPAVAFDLIGTGRATWLAPPLQAPTVVAGTVFATPAHVVASPVPLPAGTLLADPASRQIYGQSDGLGGYTPLGGDPAGGGDTYNIVNNQQSLGRAPTGGMLFALKTDSNPSVSPTAQVVAGVYPGMIVESLYCMAAGSGALTLHDSSNGALNAAERVFRIAAPAANMLYPLPTPHQVRSLLMGGQSTMGSFWVVARPAGDGDVPRYNNSFVVGVDAAGIVSPGPVYLDSIEVVAAGSANSLILYEGTDTTFRQIHSIAFGSLAALSPIRLGVGPVRLNGLRAAVPTGGQFNFRLFPI